jgi:hypothetical protein
MIAVKDTCVPRERRQPAITPGDVIKIIPNSGGGGRDNPDPPRGGGKDPAGPRGNQGPADIPGLR